MKIQRITCALLVESLTVVLLAGMAVAQDSGVCTNGNIFASANPVQSQCLGQPETAPAALKSTSSTDPVVTQVAAASSPAVQITVPAHFVDFVPPGTPGSRQAALTFQTFEGGTITWTFSGTCLGGSQSWSTTQTISCPPVGGGGGGGGNPCIGSDGGGDGSGSGVGPAPTCSPIILDIGEEGFHLTSAQAGVAFDITGTGHPIQIAWTDPHFRNAFLALPGPDGLVHNGKDLFGNFTPQRPSNHPNGFLALAEYDKPDNGGNGDGIIDNKDAVFSRLRLWIDENHDGISQPNELYTLSELGVTSISLRYHLSKIEDQYGNVFRYRARVNPVPLDDQAEVGKTVYDVFLSATK